MCGIVGITSFKEVDGRLLEGLSHLEYRGYDSAGIAMIHESTFQIRRAPGKLCHLKKLVGDNPVKGHIGIAHTRWATHGIANEMNAHPHSNDLVAVIHNGIIENYAVLRDSLKEKGYSFTSQTDTEVIVHLLTHFLLKGYPPLEALKNILQKIEGTFALAILISQHPDLILVARKGSPLVLGIGEGEMFVGSDALALSPWTNKMIYLEDGDYGVITPLSYDIYDQTHTKIDRPIKKVALSLETMGKGSYAHFMQKEIFEQPDVLEAVLSHYMDRNTHQLSLTTTTDWIKAPRLSIVACGTSYYAGMVAKYWFETYAKIPVEVDIASEFRYRNSVFLKDGIVLVISQSGETIDTLMALMQAEKENQQTIALVNVLESSIARLAKDVLMIHAGPEIGVASTKAFTAQLMILAHLVLYAATKRGTLSTDQCNQLKKHLLACPDLVRQILKNESTMAHAAISLSKSRDVLFLGRGTNFPIALEGALKLKELSYLHAEGYAAGELKHGPIALIDETIPVVVNIPSSDQWFDKTLSNVQEVAARGGQMICLTDSLGGNKLNANQVVNLTITMPDCHAFISPILYAIPMQLLSYHTALLCGTDVDQPRNLAKSVTVE